MKKRASVMQRIGFVVFPDFEVLSLGTATVFEVANVVARKELYELHVLSDSGGPVRISIGVAAQQRIFRRRSRCADPDGPRGPRPPQNLRACRGRADRRRPCSCATRGRRRLQGQTRTRPAAAPHGVRLELPTAHHRQKLARLYSRYARAWQPWKPKMLNCERPSKTRPSTQDQTLELGG